MKRNYSGGRKENNFLTLCANSFLNHFCKQTITSFTPGKSKEMLIMIVIRHDDNNDCLEL